MLVHICHDAMERGHHTVSFHLPVSDPLHELVVTAGGAWVAALPDRGCLMAKLFDPHGWVSAIYPILRQRARAAGVRLPIEIACDTGESRFVLIIARRGSRLADGGHGSSDVRCSPTALQQLLIGNVERAHLSPVGEFRFRNESVRQLVAGLFPPVLFWQSDFDGPATHSLA
jgi:hypothetical protein